MALVAPQHHYDGLCGEGYKSASCSHSGHATTFTAHSSVDLLKAVRLVRPGSSPAIPKDRVFAGRRQLSMSDLP